MDKEVEQRLLIGRLEVAMENLQEKYKGVLDAYAELHIKTAKLEKENDALIDQLAKSMAQVGELMCRDAEKNMEWFAIANRTDDELREDAPRLAVRFRDIARGIIDE